MPQHRGMCLTSRSVDIRCSRSVAGGGASGGTLVDVLLANVIREGTLRGISASK
jgi:hypothetical protein